MTFFIGVDLHKTQFTVHVRTEEKIESLEQIKQYPTTAAGYAEFLTRIETYKASGAAVKIGVESTGNTRFFKNQVEKAGAEVTVINTLKFKVINESTKKTDKHDASTISEFLSKDMLPESYLCGKETENIRRLLKSRERLVRSVVGQKNEVHALLVSMGLPDELRSLQSKKGRQKILDTLESHSDLVLEAQSVKLMFQIIDRMTESVKTIEKQLAELTKDDEITAITICGMGGELISRILEAGYSGGHLSGEERLILQPNVAEHFVREWLMNHSYRITHETVVEDNHRLYEIIVAEPVEERIEYTELEIKYGPILLKEPSELSVAKWTRMNRKNKEIMSACVKLVTGRLAAPTLEQFWALRHNFFAYFLSFFWLGSLWMALNGLWRNVERISTPVIWWSLGLLFMSSFLPYATGLVSTYFNNRTIQVFYGIIGIVTTVFNWFLHKSLESPNSDNKELIVAIEVYRKLLIPDIVIKIIGLILAVLVYPPIMMYSVLIAAAYIITFKHIKNI